MHKFNKEKEDSGIFIAQTSQKQVWDVWFSGKLFIENYWFSSTHTSKGKGFFFVFWLAKMCQILKVKNITKL